MRTMRISSLPPVLVLLVIILGGLAGFLAYLYFSQHPILLTTGEDAYNVLRDVILIVIAVLTVLTAVLIAILGWALRSILFRDLRDEFSKLIEKCENTIQTGKNDMEKSKNELLSNLFMKVGYLWGSLYEGMKDPKGSKNPVFISHAIEEEKHALEYANMLDEKEYWELRVRAINDYLMALALQADTGNANMAYEVSTELERLLEEHEQELGLDRKQSLEETIYFVRASLPRAKSKDKKNAKQAFYLLSDHADWEKWRKRWREAGLL